MCLSLVPMLWAVFSSGTESMRAGHCRVAFTCFKLAADRGYSKAQFNVGLCYEHGRGTEKDLEKVPRACLGVGVGAHIRRGICAGCLELSSLYMAGKVMECAELEGTPRDH